MVEQTLFQAPAGWLDSAVAALRAGGVEVFAPTEIEPGVVELAPVTSSEALALGQVNVVLPLKRLFIPESEVLLEFENVRQGEVSVRSGTAGSEGEMVVLGCRPCDAAALDVLDAVFQWDYDDLPYRARRERATVVAFACTEPDAQCFCTSVGGSPHGAGGSDALVFIAEDGEAIIQVGTPKGEQFVKRLGDAVRPAPEGARPPAPPEVSRRFDPEKVRQWLDANFESEFWGEVALRCLGCGACSYQCPTCHCFDIVDEGTWKGGERRRNWDCCSFALFTEHASGHNPRPNQGARYRQRVMHKFKYFPERFGRIACVGCGRCVRTCGVGLSLASVLSDIQTR